ncbi:hypothetical protein AB6805_19025 [Chitinophaga sp. RCC_12]|uniref:hypothetical protein n=1 Tax=Chitinophaga sp. RCC_12 TaxID=3239226 RepID=UPI0035240172
MKIIEKSSGISIDVLIQLIEKEDFKTMSRERFLFDWKKAVKGDEVYKLVLPDHSILGLVCLIYYPVEERVEIKLLEVSR